MATESAGILLYRHRNAELQVLLVHPGGPLWAHKDDGAWSIPKGLYEENEEPLAGAKREFEEETGLKPEGKFIALGNFRQPSGKVIAVWAVEGDFDPARLKSNTFVMEWLPKSGRMKEFPEADRAAWFSPTEAARKILRGQRAIVETLLKRLEAKP